MDQKFFDIVEKICEEDPRYKPGAYEFVMDALHFIQRRLKSHHHVSGEDLLSGIKDLTVRRFGPMALSVLTYWGVRTTEDFGNVVFNMVRYQLLAKRDEDSLDSFRNGYNFEETFCKGYRRQLEREINRIR